ncbi:hypothetical protein K505DRAFT_336698 [Melanomma pulvis-pyrius CBS 109.77]|uniref:Uncharacterized protein n=1 Tax=Melanomma pulvis-pyrius CBS 109.77 TaxID=1314802 RepID=A0A6A6XDX8_9PLEO|nr:hypothetical protein K505DRAFT_336698 [Melanomma pulvis-pyrius CBS 109.77]
MGAAYARAGSKDSSSKRRGCHATYAMHHGGTSRAGRQNKDAKGRTIIFRNKVGLEFLPSFVPGRAISQDPAVPPSYGLFGFQHSPDHISHTIQASNAPRGAPSLAQSLATARQRWLAALSTAREKAALSSIEIDVQKHECVHYPDKPLPEP